MASLSEEKNELYQLLQAAFTVELSTIPPYMTALLSIRPEKNRVAANNIRSVMMEEMLHMTLAGNIMSSIGGHIVLNADNIPSYPLSLEFEGKRFKDRDVDIDLAPFSSKTIDTFMQIELPTDWAKDETMLKAVPSIEVPGITIGAFYEMIETKIEFLCKEFGEAAVFTGKESHQVDENYYWGGGGKPIVVTDLDSAKEAITLIVSQGEGAPGSVYDDDREFFRQPEEVSHFFSFREIAFGRHYQPGDNPKEPPTGESFEVDYTCVYPIKINAKASEYKIGTKMADLSNQFNKKYTLSLNQLEDAFNGNPRLLYTAIIDGMHALASIGTEMVSTPIDNVPNSPNGAPTFEWEDPFK